MRSQYYAVLWGDKLNEVNLRISTKVDDPGAACRDTFGMVSENMRVKALGGNKSILQIDKRRREALANPETWELVPVEYLRTVLERNMREVRLKNEQR